MRAVSSVLSGRKAVVVLGGPRRFTLRTRSIGMDRRLPLGMAWTTWGPMSIERLRQQVHEEFEDRDFGLTRHEVRLIEAALDQAQEVIR